ncbi:MAG TPA: NHL repeat-containing protein, partial [Candidatus Acidoferrum sp.]|nr:NHL repeat-containing protein [Candidatus Acidoferrum sp.]
MPAATGDNIADAELGQIDFSHNGLNNPGAASLDSPSQMAVDLNSAPEHLFVVDGNNSRILGWNNAAGFTNGQKADIAIGQPDFQTTRCNSGAAGGDVAGVGPDSLCLPGGVAVDGAGNLYVADTSNNRVLEYDQPFAQSKAVGFQANRVFGQNGSFTQSVCAQTKAGLCFPQGLASDSSNNLYVADAGNNRVLEFNQPLPTSDVTADRVFGQGASGTDFIHAKCYDGFGVDPAPSADGLCNLSGLALDSAGDLFVTDISNSRVLEYLNPLAAGGGSPGLPGSSGDVTADVVFGQAGSFITSTCGGPAASGITPSGAVLCVPDG